MRTEATASDAISELAASSVSPLRADAFRTPYRDPIWDGPTDPILVSDHQTGDWVLFTQRRATETGLTGVEWVHGTAIGVARSSDGGLNWQYQGTWTDWSRQELREFRDRSRRYSRAVLLGEDGEEPDERVKQLQRPMGPSPSTVKQE